MILPTEEEFARAHAKMAEQNHLFARVRENLLKSTPAGVPLHDVFLFPSPNADYDAFVFYNTQRDVEACRSNGNDEMLRAAIVRAFATTLGCSETTAPTIRVLFDSHEHVKKVCNGNYFQYLR
jgi:hypothetical protein